MELCSVVLVLSFLPHPPCLCLLLRTRMVALKPHSAIPRAACAAALVRRCCGCCGCCLCCLCCFLSCFSHWHGRARDAPLMQAARHTNGSCRTRAGRQSHCADFPPPPLPRLPHPPAHPASDCFEMRRYEGPLPVCFGFDLPWHPPPVATPCYTASRRLCRPKPGRAHRSDRTLATRWPKQRREMTVGWFFHMGLSAPRNHSAISDSTALVGF